MSGLRKAKKYDWKDSNLALFGSDLEKNIKKESAEGEPAWEGAGSKIGTQIWRIVKFKVTHWPKEDYGRFYNGDSYIVLNTYKKDPDSEKLSYDVHFWIGKESTQDEYGAAAYKTVELDHFKVGKNRPLAPTGHMVQNPPCWMAKECDSLQNKLNDEPVQHREVQGNESKLFKSYFDNYIVMKGGADSGFNKVQPEQYKPRLFVCDFVKKKKTELTEKKLKRKNMNNGAIVIIDLGVTIYQWNGKEANHFEKFKARSFIETLKSERSGRANVVLLDNQTVEDFHPRLETIIPPDDNRPKKHKQTRKPIEKVLSRLSDASGRLKFDEVGRGEEVCRSLLDTKDVFVFETDGHCFIWTGDKASPDERRRSMEFAHKYMMKSERPLAPISCVKEGNETADFINAFS